MHAGLHETIAELRAENDELREELRAIREQAPEDYVVKHFLGCRPAVARLICAFLRSTGYISRDAALNAASKWPDAIDGEKLIDVYVHFARRSLAPHGIEIETIRGFGFGIAPDHLARLRRLVAPSSSCGGEHSADRAGQPDSIPVSTAPPDARATASWGE